MNAKKKYLVTYDNKVLRTNDQIDPVTSLLYHDGSKNQKTFKNIMSINIRKEWWKSWIIDLNHQSTGAHMRNVDDIERKTRLEFLKILNTTTPSKSGRMPNLRCDLEVYPDYLALYNEPGKYTKTLLTAPCFYLWDEKFDDYDGLLNAIKYNIKDKLDSYKKRFHGVKMIISPDYSLVGNIYPTINEGRIFDSRLVSLWFTNELGIIVIPNMTYTDESSFPMMIDGLDECKVVCFSAMSCLTDKEDRDKLEKAIKYTVDHLKLNAIIVYTSTPNDDKINDIFKYAIENNVKIVIPDNTIRESNRRKLNGKS